MTYLPLSAAFLSAALLVLSAGLLRSGRARPLIRSWWLPALLALVVLFGLTAIFDNIMIMVGLFSYDWAQTSGVRIGVAPIEDFAYPLGAMIILPGLWLMLSPRRSRRTAAADPPSSRADA